MKWWQSFVNALVIQQRKALQKDVTHVVEKVWAKGTVQVRTKINNIATGFDVNKGGLGADAKEWELHDL